MLFLAWRHLLIERLGALTLIIKIKNQKVSLRSFLMGATKTETKPSFVSVFVFCRILWVCKIRKRNTGSVTYKTELEFCKC